jgi:hypothetical protein
LTAEFLADKPPFDHVADDFLAFVGDAPLVAHNAGFDIAFLIAELKRAAKPPIATERVVDTLVLARRKHAGGLPLDDLCARYGIDRSHRSKSVRDDPLAWLAWNQSSCSMASPALARYHCPRIGLTQNADSCEVHASGKPGTGTTDTRACG